jgi:hypothetical protein
MNERKARTLIERHFVEPLPAAQFKKLWEHVSACRGCKAHYDKLFLFDERLDGGKAEVERIGQSLFAAMEPKRAPLFAFTWPFPRVAALAGAALLVFLIAGPLLRVPQSADDFTARGAAVAHRPELLATCFKDVSGKIRDVQHLDAREGAPACARGGRLAFAYRNARAGEQLALFAVRGAEVSRLVAPVAVTEGPGQQPLAGAFAIDADAPAGEVKLVAVFGRSLDADRLEAALKAGQDLKAAAPEDAVVRTLSYRLDKP